MPKACLTLVEAHFALLNLQPLSSVSLAAVPVSVSGGWLSKLIPFCLLPTRPFALLGRPGPTPARTPRVRLPSGCRQLCGHAYHPVQSLADECLPYASIVSFHSPVKSPYLLTALASLVVCRDPREQSLSFIPSLRRVNPALLPSSSLSRRRFRPYGHGVCCVVVALHRHWQQRLCHYFELSSPQLQQASFSR